MIHDRDIFFITGGKIRICVRILRGLREIPVPNSNMKYCGEPTQNCCRVTLAMIFFIQTGHLSGGIAIT